MVIIKTVDISTHGPSVRSILISNKKTIVPESEPAEPVLSCDGAVPYVSFSMTETNYDNLGFNSNHTTLQYNVTMDNVDYGLFDLSENVQLDNVSLEVYFDSSGNASMYAYAPTNNDLAHRFKFTPREDMLDANIWGVNIEDNPTAIYDADTRSLMVCLTSYSNV